MSVNEQTDMPEEPNAKFLAIHHVSVVVADVARALQFYAEVLGLSIDPGRPDLGYPGAWLRICEQQQIHLLEVPNPEQGLVRPEHGGRDRHFALLVRDFAQVRQALDAAQVSYTLSRSGRKALFCRDPDDNAIEIIG